MDSHKRDIQGLGLSVLNRVAGSKAMDSLGLRKPAEQALYQASRAGFKAASMANRQFRNVSKLVSPSRMQPQSSGDLFDLRPSDEQAMMQEAARRFAEERLRPEASDAEQHCEPSAEVWAAASDLGLTLMAVPEELGGAGAERSAVTSGLVAEALGWGDMGQAAALLAPVGVANVLASWGTAEQQGRYLHTFAQDDAPDAAIAILEPQAAFDPLDLRCKATRQGDSWIINGEKSLVPLGRFADLLIVGAHCLDLGPRLLLVEAHQPGISRQAHPGMGLHAASLGRLRFEQVRVNQAAMIGDEHTYLNVVQLGRLAWCSLAVGCAQAVLDLVKPYTLERKAFGSPIAHRQAVAFMVANIAIEVDAMRLMVWRALSRFDQGLPITREAALAHRFCAEKAMQIGSDGVQLLGGHGFVKEYPVERWYRDLRAVGVMEGGLLA